VKLGEMCGIGSLLGSQVGVKNGRKCVGLRACEGLKWDVKNG